MEIKEINRDGTTLLQMNNGILEVETAPEVGGKITCIRDLKTGHQFLWSNHNLPLRRLPVGSEYDPCFYGGIDELLPNDIPEEIDGILFPDHGELWTMELEHRLKESSIILRGKLPLSGLSYCREMELSSDKPEIILRYRIESPTGRQKKFLWKLHAALEIEPGDEIICPAKTAVVADPEWSRWTNHEPFSWPNIEGQRADLIPPKGTDVDFLYLYDLTEGYMGWRRPKSGLTFAYRFDSAVFPYCWYFASYGGFYQHYTAVLEPCTTMPCSVREASALRQCSVLEPGEVLETTVRLYAGSETQLAKCWEK